MASQSVLVLGDEHRHELTRLVDTEPLVNAMASARLRAVRSLAPVRFGATPLGVGEGGALRAAAFHGANLVPIGGDDGTWRVLAGHLGALPRGCTSMVGRADAVEALWSGLRGAWGEPRAIRRRQPLLVRDNADGLRDDARLRLLRVDEIEAYLPAAAAMFTEELGISPLTAATAPAYRRRADHLLRSERVYGIVDKSGSVQFKADIGALTPHTCQIQGVWVRPDLRGFGLGAAGMAAVLLRGLALAPTVSLYVNDFNVAARRLYAGLGMRQAGELSTVLF